MSFLPERHQCLKRRNRNRQLILHSSSARLVNASIESNSDWNLFANLQSIAGHSDFLFRSLYFSLVVSSYDVRVYLHVNFYRFLNNKPFLTGVRLGMHAAKGSVPLHIAHPYRGHTFEIHTNVIHLFCIASQCTVQT